MAIHPDGYPAADPRDDEPTAGDVTDIYCSSCERETEHTRTEWGAWECQYIALHAAAQAGLEDYVHESIMEAFRRRLGWANVGRREREIADEVAKMAENHVPDVMDAES